MRRAEAGTMAWNDAGYSGEPATFAIVSMIFFLGFVWLVAEAIWGIGEFAGRSSAMARFVGIAVAVVVYGSIAVGAWAADPGPLRAGGDSYRVVLSLSWAAGYLQATGHYSSVECGY
jgi:hypothetical protein